MCALRRESHVYSVRRSNYVFALSAAVSATPDCVHCWDPAVGSDSFRRSLKTFLFATYWDMQRIRGPTRMRYINLLLLTYLLTCTCTWIFSFSGFGKMCHILMNYHFCWFFCQLHRCVSSCQQLTVNVLNYWTVFMCLIFAKLVYV